MPDVVLPYLEEYRRISLHRSSGFAGAEPILPTLDIYDRKMGIDRDPHEVDIIITLDIIERASIAKQREKTKDNGNRR